MGLRNCTVLVVLAASTAHGQTAEYPYELDLKTAQCSQVQKRGLETADQIAGTQGQDRKTIESLGALVLTRGNETQVYFKSAAQCRDIGTRLESMNKMDGFKPSLLIEKLKAYSDSSDTGQRTESQVTQTDANVDQAGQSLGDSNSGSQSGVRRSPDAPSAFADKLVEIARTVPDKRAQRALKLVLADPARFRFQWIITLVDTPAAQSPTFKTYEYRVDHQYFYPASAMKTFGSLAALMEWTRLKKVHPWLSLESALAYDRRGCKQRDRGHLISGLVTLGQEIRKTQLASSNKGFNRVFGIVGMDKLHEYLLPHFPSLRVYHRLSSRETRRESMGTPGIRVCETDGQGAIVDDGGVYGRTRFRATGKNAPIFAADTAPYSGYGKNRASFQVGSAHIHMKTKERLDAPMDFSKKNRVSFYDFHRLTAGLHFQGRALPGFKAVDVSGQIRGEWLGMLRHSMATYPHNSKNPVYTSKAYTETRFKPLLAGIREAGIDDGRLYYANKSGKAYGFHVDNAYIAYGPGAGQINNRGRTKGQIERGIIVTMGLHVNGDDTINNNRYEHGSVSVPLFKAMGYAIGQYLRGDVELE